jgi:hypothetical protein
MEATNMRLGVRPVIAALVLPMVPSLLSGQEIRVQVVASESREPIPTAFLTLLDHGTDPIRHALSNEAGRVSFLLPGSGMYRVKAEVFGRATSVSPWFQLSEDTVVFHRFDLPVEAIPIAGIRAESDKRCRINPRDGREIARVWEEVEKALSIQTWTDEAGLFRTHILAWDRRLDPDGQAVSSDAIREFSTTARNPIQSLPVDSLLSHGFIRRGENRITEYFGPDASVLLSNPFLNTHCFHLVDGGDRPDLIGLGFRPTREEPIDIEGTFWVHRETAQLRFLEFKYVNAPIRFTEGVAGGRVDFERLPDGAWIVRRWWIRMPLRAASWIFGRKRLVAIHETGQVVSKITPVSGTGP